MYVIRESTVKVNDKMVPTFRRFVEEGDISLEVEAGSTGYAGGDDRSAGGRTYVSLFCGSGDFYFSPVRDKYDRVTGMEIAACGDAALDAVVKALGFALKALDDRRCGVED